MVNVFLWKSIAGQENESIKKNIERTSEQTKKNFFFLFIYDIFVKARTFAQ